MECQKNQHRLLHELFLVCLVTPLCFADPPAVSPVFWQDDDIQGTEFWVAFMRHMPSNYQPALQKLSLYITNPAPIQTKVTIHTLRNQTESSETHTIQKEETLTITVDSALMLEDATIHSHSVYITSDSSILLQASIDYFQIGGKQSTEGFTVLPTIVGRYYVVATHCESEHCVLVILTTEDDTSVTVKLRIGEGGKAQFNGRSYVDGEDITEHGLARGQSIQILCNACDLTGTTVRGGKDEPLSVFAGGEFTSVLNSTNHDLVVEQMRPLRFMGSNYVLGSNLAPDTLELVKVVTMKQGDTFSYNGQNYIASQQREVFTFARNSSELVEIIGDGQLLVSQFLRGEVTEPLESVMIMSVPFYQWSTHYQVFVPLQAAGETVHQVILSLLLPRGCGTNIVVSVNVVTSTITSQGDYDMMTMTLEKGGLIRVWCDETKASACQPFWGYVVHNMQGRSSAVPLQAFLTCHCDQNVSLEVSPCDVSSATDSIATSASASQITTTMDTTVSTSHNIDQASNAVTLAASGDSDEVFSSVVLEASIPKNDVTSSAMMSTSPLENDAILNELSLSSLYVDDFPLSSLVVTSSLEIGVTATAPYLMSSPENDLNAAVSILVSSHDYGVTSAEGTPSLGDEFTSISIVSSSDENELTSGALTSFSDEYGFTSTEIATSSDEIEFTSTGIETLSDEIEFRSTGFETISYNIDVEFTFNEFVTSSDEIGLTSTGLLTSSDTIEFTSSRIVNSSEVFGFASAGTVPVASGNRLTETVKKYTPKKTCCKCVQTKANPISQEQQEKIVVKNMEDIKTKLTENKKQMSSYIRSKTSASDERKSSTVVGATLGIVCLTVVFGILLGLDFTRCIVQVEKIEEKKITQKSTENTRKE